LKVKQGDNSEGSTAEALDASTKLQAWKEVVGGKSIG